MYGRQEDIDMFEESYNNIKLYMRRYKRDGEGGKKEGKKEHVL